MKLEYNCIRFVESNKWTSGYRKFRCLEQGSNNPIGKIHYSLRPGFIVFLPAIDIQHDYTTQDLRDIAHFLDQVNKDAGLETP